MRRVAQLVGALCALALVVTMCGCGGSGGLGGPTDEALGKPAKPPPGPVPTPYKLAYMDFTQLKPTRQSGGFTSYTNGTGVSQILADAQYLSWSHSTTNPRICFTTHVSGVCLIGICNADGSDVEQFTTGAETGLAGSVGDFFAHWSPDDTAIVFQRGTGSYPNGGGMETVICVKEVATGTCRQLTDGHSDTDPAWSPDGQYIMFNRYPDGLMVVPAAEVGGTPYCVKDPVPLPGGGVERLAASDPDWSADNRVACIDGSGSVSYVQVNADGRYVSGPHVLYPRTSGFLAHPTWSPNMSEIAFSREYWQSLSKVSFTLFVLDVAKKQVTAEWSGGFPDWSPELP